MQNHVFIIAEAGVNHNGNLDIAKEMVLEAKKAGTDAVKFQTGKSERVISKFAQKADYQKETTGDNESQLDMVRKLELSFEDFAELKRHCDKVGIIFVSTPFDLESIVFLNELGMRIFKVPSGEITNLPYLIKIAKLGREVIMSTGMSYLTEVELAVNILREYGTNNIALLHCTTEYPAPCKDVNLRAILTLKKKFHLPVGYSDHTKGIEISIAAAAMGASVIEKHFTLDRNMEGPDHRASLEPHELKDMVSAIRNVEAAFGNGEKKPAESEEKNIAVARKSIVANRKIKRGEVFSEENLTTKRPGNGISPMQWFEVLGKTAVKDFEEDELIVL